MMNFPTKLAAWSCIFVIIQLSEKAHSNPYGYYGAYSRTRRDPTAWNPAYAGMAQPNPMPVIPNVMAPRHGMPNYGGRMDNQGNGRGAQDGNRYGVSQQYGAVDNSLRNPLMGRIDSASQHGSRAAGGGPDLGGYESQQHFPGSSQQQSEGTIGSLAPDGCDGVKCQDLRNCINVTVNDTKCCPKCKTYGCICEGYQVYDCQQNGFADGMVPEGKSYTVAGGTTVCSCPPGGGAITCSFHDPQSSKCPELPPNCVNTFVREIDGCSECSMVGCTAEDGTVVEQGMTKEKPPCSTCYCPPQGGKMICGVDEACEKRLSGQGTGSLAMESSIREINSMGQSSEANAYGGYANGYGGYPDYGGQFGQSAGTRDSPVVPPVSPLGTGNSGVSKDADSAGVSTDGQGATGQRTGYDPYGSYQQGYNTGYQNPYGQFGSYGQGGYRGSYPGYGNFGYNQAYSQGGTGYPQQADDKTKSQVTEGTQGVEKTQNGLGSSQRVDSYGYQMGGYNPYDQQPYVPSLTNTGSYSPYGSKSTGATADASKQSSGTESEPSKTGSTPDVSQGGAGMQNPGNSFGGYGQYYHSDYYGQYRGYNQFQPQLPVGSGGADPAATTESPSEKSPEKSGADAAATDGQQNQFGAQPQVPYNPYGGYNSYYGSQYGFPHQQMPVDAVSPYGPQGAGQGSLEPNALPHDTANTQQQQPSEEPQAVSQKVPEQQDGTLNGQGTLSQSNYPYPSGASQEASQNTQDQQGAALNGQGNAYQPNYPYYPYDQQQLYPAYPPQSGSQYEPINPALMQPSATPDGAEQTTTTGRKISRQYPQPTHSESSGTRRIRDNLNVINKGRFTHERGHYPTTTTTSTATTTRPTTKTTTTTPKPTTTTTTTRPTTTTTTTRATTTTTTTRPTTTTTTTRPTTTTRSTTTPPPTTTTTTTTTPPPTTTTTPPPTTTTTPRPTPTTTKSSRRHRQQGASLERVLKGCCSRGRRWAEGHDTCGGISAMSGTYSHICSVAQEKCCLEAKERQTCQSGMLVARSQANCDVPTNLANTCGANEFKTCCDCCQMGLKAVELGLACDANIFGERCNKAYAECCNNAKTEWSRYPRPSPTPTEAITSSPEISEPSGPRCATHSRCQQVCDDTSSGMVCSCRRGYRLHKNKRDCVDVNECVLNTHTCTEHQICLNRQGSFYCQRRISCGTGYDLTERNTCEDIDECEHNIDDCHPNTDCENIRGSYRCIPKLCDAGFITDATGRCIDINECRTREYSCPKEASCRNTEGSYECRCPAGLLANADNTVCEDVDECALGTAGCRQGATCINTVGSFVCQNPPKLRCAPGYEPDGNTRTCKDIDECSRNTHTCKSGSTCINELGGFRCQDPLICPSGMRADEAGDTCLDIDECQDPSLHQCDTGGRCANLDGTFKCVCYGGYEHAVTETGVPTCRDVNECDSELGDACYYKCRNLPGKYECYCPPGYEVGESGEGCQDIDECGGRESPCADGETCFNTHGSHKCVDLSCPAGYSRVSNTRKYSRCTRESCRGKPRSCLKVPKQISFHNISLNNGTTKGKPLFRMSLARSNPTDRYDFDISDGNAEGAFKVKSSTRISRPTGVVYTAQELTGPKEYVVDLSLTLARGRRRSTFVSRLYIFVGEYDM